MGKLAHLGRTLAGLLILVTTTAMVGTPGSAHAAAGPSAGFVVGRAQHPGNDYPWETLGQFEHQDQGTDPWNEYYGQCDSFAAWKAYENLNGAGAVPKPPPKPAAYPAPNWSPANAAISNVDQNTWGNAGDWVTSARAHGWVVDAVATPGSIPIWNNGHLGPVGHVGYVDDVYADGSITIENYNLHANGEYSKFHLPRGGGPETSFGATYQLPWPDGFAHIADGPARAADGTVLPPEQPVLTTTEYGYAYSPDVTLVGPGSPASQFSTTGTWPTRPGHGELATMRYAPTSGSATAPAKTAPATATATWRPTGLLPNTCYRIDAFVPDNYSDNPAASYTVAGLSGTSAASVNENAFTNDWAELGIYRATAAGGLTVHLDNRGATGLYVAADAVRFWQQPTC